MSFKLGLATVLLLSFNVCGGSGVGKRKLVKSDEASIKSIEDDRDNNNKKIRVTYTYAVKGEAAPREDHVIVDPNNPQVNYPKGAAVTVCYDPAEPDYSVLRTPGGVCEDESLR
jgi:hypothetical protein